VFTPARAAAKAAPGGEKASPERQIFEKKGARHAPETPAKARGGEELIPL
jgi:hypothetical protein